MPEIFINGTSVQAERDPAVVVFHAGTRRVRVPGLGLFALSWSKASTILQDGQGFDKLSLTIITTLFPLPLLQLEHGAQLVDLR